MPKISAPTLAEHQARRRQDLVDAAVAILAEEGVAALTPAAAGARASLARSSTYQYFDTSAALLATAVESAYASVDRRLVAATSACAGDPGAVVDAYVTDRLGSSGTVEARALGALRHAELPPMCAARVVELDRARRAPLVAALVELGVGDPEAVGELVDALVDTGGAQVVRGGSMPAAVARVLALVHDGLGPH